MKKQKSKGIGQTADSMSTVDQGLNLIPQMINKATGLDKSNDGKMNNMDKEK